MTMITSRRALLKAAPLATAALAIPAFAAATTIPTDRSAWNSALAAYHRVRAEDAAFSARYMPIWDRCKASCDRVPHVALRPDPYSGRKDPVTTADEWLVRMARYEVKRLDSGKMRIDANVPGVQEHYDLKRELARAADERDAARQRIRDRFGMDDMDDQSDRLGDRLARAEEALMDTPAPDLAALRFKLDHLLEPDSDGSTACWSRAYVAQTVADYQRLLGAA